MSFYKNAGGMVRPSTKEELRNEIEIRLDRGQYNLNDIDTSKITNMGGLFARFNQNRNLSKIDISGWDTSSVVDMSYMFAYCETLESVGNLLKWNVSKVTNMSSMFYGCKALKTVGDISGWDVSKVNDMTFMFYNCVHFNQDISKWDVSKVTNMTYMFYRCKKFNQDLSKWNVSNVRYHAYTFYNCSIKEEYKPKFK